IARGVAADPRAPRLLDDGLPRDGERAAPDAFARSPPGPGHERVHDGVHGPDAARLDGDGLDRQRRRYGRRPARGRCRLHDRGGLRLGPRAGAPARRGRWRAGSDGNDLRAARFVLVTVVGCVVGLIGGYVPAAVVLNVMMASSSYSLSAFETANTVSKLLLFATAGANVAVLQRATGFTALPRWWPPVSAAGWPGLI